VSRYQTKVRAYTYRAPDGTGTPGAFIDIGKHSIFVPTNRLRQIADRCHDIADEYEQEGKA
jgi:hypothetical protein